MDAKIHLEVNSAKAIKGRGTADLPDARYLAHTRSVIDDGWYGEPESVNTSVKTSVTIEKPKTIITRNSSPDIPFEQSINPYRGCEHGCIYCYARPTHAYFDLSPGLDFETRLFAKPNAVTLLKQELAKPNYQCTPIALGTNTDPYQPIERKFNITRQIITLLKELNHPLTIVTKSSLVERDIDLLSEMAEKNLAQVFISITTLNNKLMQKLEPRAASPARRLKTISRLVKANIPTGVMFAPVIPVLNDSEMEHILEQATTAGARRAGYVLLRLPHEIKSLFKGWLDTHYPLKASHIMSIIRQIRGGKDNDPQFHSRMTGKGIYADLIRQRFNKVCHQLDLNKPGLTSLDSHRFIKPVLGGQQYELF